MNTAPSTCFREDRASYTEPPEELFADRPVCVDGVISEYRGIAQIQAEPGAVQLADEVEDTAFDDILEWDCESESDPFAKQICLDIQKDYEDFLDEQYADAVDALDDANEDLYEYEPDYEYP